MTDTPTRDPGPARRPWLRWLIAAGLVVLLVVAGFGAWALGEAGMLPGQPEATRIPVTPFAGIPGFDSFPTPPPLPTAAP